jgi:hypothetical protein
VKRFIVHITANYEFPCEAKDAVEAEMLGRHVAAGELGNTPLLGAADWSFNAYQEEEGDPDPWAV